MQDLKCFAWKQYSKLSVIPENQVLIRIAVNEKFSKAAVYVEIGHVYWIT